ncbi:fatty acid desaturase family protein [Vibrio penaeicida]|uniref:fatty acid desaturase family protein n=1 Tax=Vibrio penaeicida TaxID=104609 RepID=UPI000F84BFB9|nr:fatty acid desaturase family protein [Vibrio penaeicida]RTZ23453.1 phosphoesterase [Vibrio penaeicida]
MMFERKITNELNELSTLNNYRGVLGVLSDWFFVSTAIGISIYSESLIIYLFSVVIIGARQKGLATLLHESAHRVLARNITLNDFLGKYFTGYMVFQTFKTYAKSHVVMHHNYLGNVKKDPDFKLYIDSGLYDDISKREFVFRFLISPFLFSRTPYYIKYLVVNRLGNIKDSEVRLLLVYWFVIISTTMYLGLFKYLVLYWFVPLVTVFPIIGWFVEMAEHYPIIEDSKGVRKTRNRFSSPLEMFLTGLHAENYHLTHHLNPSIPYWNLKKAHEIMMKDKEYRESNEIVGGIFSSSNGKPSLWKMLLSKRFDSDDISV